MIDNGKLSRFEELVETYRNKIYTIAYRFMGNEADACDLAQEVFIRAYLKLDTFRGDSSLLTWLYQITANLCRDELRRRKVRSTVSLDAENPQQGAVNRYREVNGTMAGPEEVAETRELQKNLQLVLNRLPAEQRLVIIMREVQGFSYEEIAAHMECSLGTVKSRLSRARLALRELVLTNSELFGLRRQEPAGEGGCGNAL